MSASLLLHQATRRLYRSVRQSFSPSQRLPSTLEIREEEMELACQHKTACLTSFWTSNLGKFPYKLQSNSILHQQRRYSKASSRISSRADEAWANAEHGPTKEKSASDPRAFQRTRAEYDAITHDVSQRRQSLDLDDVVSALNEASVLKTKAGPSDITGLLCKLSQIAVGQTPKLRKDSRFNLLLQHSVGILEEFSVAQLTDILRSFVNLAMPSSHSVLAAFEAEFIKRATEMDLHQLLLVADLWRCLKRYVPRYLECVYDVANKNLSQIGPAEMVQLIYIIGESRGCPAFLLKPIEHHLMRLLSKLNPEELGAVCLGLFKARTRLSNRVVLSLVDRCCALVKDLSDVGIVNVMKLLRFSYLDHVPYLEAMSSEVPVRAAGMEAPGLMHVVLGFSALHYRDEGVFLAVGEQIPKVSRQCRSKDAAKVLWAFGTLGFLPSQCPELYSSLTEVLRERRAEFEKYPEHLLTALLGLAFAGVFPRDLLELALSPESVERACRSPEFELKRDLFTLDGTVGLELADSTLPRLSHALREEITRTVWDFAQQEICPKLEVIEAEAMLGKLLGGDELVRKCMILPHSRSIDLEVHLDENGGPLPVSSRLGSIHTPSHASPPASVQKLAVQVSSRNHYCYRTERLLGLYALKRRHLALAGYRVVELPHWEWLPLLRRPQAEKLAYLHCKIFN